MSALPHQWLFNNSCYGNAEFHSLYVLRSFVRTHCVFEILMLGHKTAQKMIKPLTGSGCQLGPGS